MVDAPRNRAELDADLSEFEFAGELPLSRADTADATGDDGPAVGPEVDGVTTNSSSPDDSTISTRIQALVLESGAAHEFLERLAHIVADHFSTSDRTVLCGITLIQPRVKTTVASSSDRALAMDEIQYAFGDGPCVDAARHQHINYVSDVLNVDDEEARWPEYLAAIAEHGLRSILAVPIPLLEDETGCAINVYADAPDAFTPADIEAVQNLAREASATVRIAVHVARLSDTTDGLRAAMASRTSIDLAAGIIMAQNRCSQERAITILKAASSARNIKLRDLAGNIIASITTELPATHFDI